MFKVFRKINEDNRRKIGYYRPCDILTMSGTVFAITAMMLAISAVSYDGAVLCIILSGICDCLDGYLARLKKYDKIQTTYGAELDSLSDVIAFGVAPALITICMLGFNHITTILVAVFYIMAGLIRLAYYNTLDINGIDTKGYFKGLPITTVAIVYPVVYFIFTTIFDYMYFDIALTITLFTLGVFYITPIRVKKLDNKSKFICTGLGLLAILLFIIKIIFF